MEQLTLIFLGPQGSGKGTQVELLKEYIAKQDTRPIMHFEAGKSLREFAQGDGYTKELMRSTMASGGLVPLFLSTRAFSDSLADTMQSDEHLILDGFPRTADQLPVLDSALQFYKRANTVVLNINISDEEALKRLLLRKRSDDTEEGIKKRLSWTRAEAGAIHEWFRSHPAYRFIEINGEQPVEMVQQEIRAALGLA